MRTVTSLYFGVHSSTLNIIYPKCLISYYNFTEFSCNLLCIQKHKLPLSYNFHKYMVRSMEDELHGILGIRYALFYIGSHFFIQLPIS